MGIKDFTAIPNTTANEIQENITTHNILVVILITHYVKEYSKTPLAAQRLLNSKESIKYHRTFSMLVLHLIQCPDLTFQELINLISCGKYQLPQFFIRSYLLEIHHALTNDLNILLSMFRNLEGNLLDNGLPKVHPIKIINGGSPIGVFLRRVVVFFDKMQFLQTHAVMKEMKNSCLAVLNEMPVRNFNIFQ